MKRAVMVGGLLLCSLSQAYATTHYEMNYRDIIRPHGHKRSEAVYNSALSFCYGQTGLSRGEADTQACAPAASDRRPPSRCAVQLGARQRPLPDVDIVDGKVSWCGFQTIQRTGLAG